MAKYIDADKLKYDLMGLFAQNNMLTDEWIANCVRAVIDDQPTADVQEVKNGRWFEHQEGRWIYAKCSVCNTVRNTPTNYCPNCGASMDEVEE